MHTQQQAKLELELDPEDAPKANGKRVQGGVSTSDVVMTAFVSGNAEVFPQILNLHVPDGAKIADVTYGTGVFSFVRVTRSTGARFVAGVFGVLVAMISPLQSTTICR